VGGKEASTKVADQEIALAEFEFGVVPRRSREAGQQMASHFSAYASANDGRPIFSSRQMRETETLPCAN
jgi:hypothetical protein